MNAFKMGRASCKGQAEQQGNHSLYCDSNSACKHPEGELCFPSWVRRDKSQLKAEPPPCEGLGTPHSVGNGVRESPSLPSPCSHPGFRTGS